MTGGTGRAPIVGVMGSGTDPHEEFSLPLGRWLGSVGCHLLTGGGGGVMEACARGFCETRRSPFLSIGIIPTVEVDGRYVPKQGYPNAYVDLPILTPLGSFDPLRPDSLTRNYANVLSSDVVIGLPGSAGTRNEIELALRFGKPLILFGPQELFFRFPMGLFGAEELEAVKGFVQSRL